MMVATSLGLHGNFDITSVIWSHHKNACIFTLDTPQVISAAVAACRASGPKMSQGWKWGIAIGSLIAFFGLLIIPSAFSTRNTDPVPLSAGLAIFAMGVLMISVSFYLRGRSMGAQIASEPASGGARRKYSCDVCRKAPAVIQCTMHKMVFCSSCLSGHYDSRACVYVPTVRRASGKTARTATASRS